MAVDEKTTLPAVLSSKYPVELNPMRVSVLGDTSLVVTLPALAETVLIRVSVPAV